MKPRSAPGILGFIFFITLPPLAGGQTSQEPAPAQPTVYQLKTVLKANTRLVVVNVVATDSKGQPVSGLEAQDFAVLEDGQPQKISSFGFQSPDVKEIQATLHLPPNVVSNIPQQKATSLNVILLDTLNGDFSGHAQAQDALIKYLATAQLTQPIAIFAMEKKLTMLHDFTNDSQALKSVVEKFRPPAQRSSETAESRASVFPTRGDFHTDDRNIEATLSQLHALARTLAGYPGRKNVIWLSESFPLMLVPETAIPSISVANFDGLTRIPSTYDELRSSHLSSSNAALVKKLADAMMNAQVAIYPVDSTGLTKDDHLGSQHTMNDLAFSTGGRAFYNRNDLEVSLRTSLDDGATYYTLTYYPENKNWDGKFRSIAIRSTRPDVKLRYRLGYYALDPGAEAKDEQKQAAEDFSRALTLDAPSITAVLFQAGIVPPGNKTKDRVTVNFAIDPHTLAFEKTNDGLERASVNCVVWAYPGKGDPVRSEGGSTAALNPEVYKQVMSSYFPCQRTLELKPGHYTLRLGVLDRIINQIGTTSTPLTVP